MGGDHSTMHHKITLAIIRASMVLSGCVESVNGDRSNFFSRELSKIQVIHVVVFARVCPLLEFCKGRPELSYSVHDL